MQLLNLLPIFAVTFASYNTTHETYMNRKRNNSFHTLYSPISLSTTPFILPANKKNISKLNIRKILFKSVSAHFLTDTSQQIIFISVKHHTMKMPPVSI